MAYIVLFPNNFELHTPIFFSPPLGLAFPQPMPTLAVHLAGERCSWDLGWVINTRLGRMGCHVALAGTHTSSKPGELNGPSFLSIVTPHLSPSHVTSRRFYTEAAQLSQGS